MDATLLRRTAVVCVLALALGLAGCKELLFSRLTEAQANEVLATLSQARIEAAKSRIEDDVWQVEVDGADVGRALVYLRNRGVPAQHGPKLGEVFKKDGLISSALEERARYAAALQDGLAETLRRIDGVSDARVHVALPHNDPLSSRVVPVSAAVFIKHLPALDIEMLTPNIKSMVMAAVEGLDYRNITLVAVRATADAAPVPVQLAHNGGFMSAQAAGFEPVVPAAPAVRLGAGVGEPLVSAAAGVGLVAGIGWWMRRRRGGRSSGRAVAAGQADRRPGTFDSPRPTDPARTLRAVPDAPRPPPADMFAAARRRNPR
jgi:type III secretion protein J